MNKKNIPDYVSMLKEYDTTRPAPVHLPDTNYKLRDFHLQQYIQEQEELSEMWLLNEARSSSSDDDSSGDSGGAPNPLRKGPFWWSLYGDINSNQNAEYGASSVYDNEGNLYVVGTIEDYNLEVYRSLIIKYAPDGTIIWCKTFNANYDTYGESIRYNPIDNCLYVLFNTSQSAWYVVAKINTDGTLLKSVKGDVDSNMNGLDLTIDQEGKVYVLADYKRTYEAPDKLVIMKIDLSPSVGGTLLWAKWIGFNVMSVISQHGKGYGSIEYNNGYVYVTGGAYLGGGIIWTAKLNAQTGAKVWLKDIIEHAYNQDPSNPAIPDPDHPEIGATGTYGMSLCLDEQQNVYVTSFSPEANGGSFIYKYNSNGVFQWTRTLNFYTGGGVVDINYKDGYLYSSGSLYEGPPGPSIGEGVGYLYWNKVNAVTGDISYHKVFAVDESASYMDVRYFKGHNIASIHGDKLSVCGYAYHALDSGTPVTTQRAHLIALQVPLDGDIKQIPYGGFVLYTAEQQSLGSLGNANTWFSEEEPMGGSGVDFHDDLDLSNPTSVNWQPEIVVGEEYSNYTYNTQKMI